MPTPIPDSDCAPQRDTWCAAAKFSSPERVIALLRFQLRDAALLVIGVAENDGFGSGRPVRTL